MHNNLLCNEQLRRRITEQLSRLQVIPRQASGARRAAVALTIIDAAGDPGIYGMSTAGAGNGEAGLILTRRAARLKSHAGQWALPGGRMEAHETPEEAALRELSEEAGLHRDSSSVLGRLDDFVSRSGYVITPVVVWGGPDAVLKPNPAEVQSIHRIRLSEFLRDDSPIIEETGSGGSPLLMMPVGTSWIAAPTAAIIYQFREAALLGRATRVAHYEQPFFAWH